MDPSFLLEGTPFRDTTRTKAAPSTHFNFLVIP